ncbi:MAG: hypothetical protein H6737_08365 [Alphaproteobacteria bacterium]|nr:hypothetical protein [Alphaproteobacteria bacterium]
MSFYKIVAAFAAVATLVQLVLVAVVGAHFLTLDGNTLRIVAFVIALVLAIGLPLALSLGAIRSLEGRGRQPRRGALAAGIFALVNGLGATGLLWSLESPVASLWSGTTRLVTFEAAAPEATGGDEVAPKPETAPPKGSDAVEGARKAVRAVLSGDDPKELPAALSDESAAALGTLWMGFLVENMGPDLATTAGPELWASVHQGLPDQPGLWGDPAALEEILVPRGRAFLGDVLELADAATDGHGTGPMSWPVLPEAVVAQTLAHGADTAWKAEYTEVAMNRVQAKVSDAAWDVRYEDHGWRVHLGDYGDLATRRIAPRTMMIALRP